MPHQAAQDSVEDLAKAFDQLVKQLPSPSRNEEYKHLTVFQFLENDTVSAKFHHMLEQCPRLISLLQDIGQEHTVFLPGDQCHGELHDVHPEDVEKLVSLHISPHYVTSEGLLRMPNVPTLLIPPTLNGPQIVRARVSENSWELNYASHMVSDNIICSNGVIHRIDRSLALAPDIMEVLKLNNLHLFRTAVAKLSGGNDSIPFPPSTIGGTVFAPTDEAFAKLKPHLLHFLFETDVGLPYLRALVELHLVPSITFFSNFIWPQNNTGGRQTSKDEPRMIKGRLTRVLPTLLKPNSIGGGSVDITVTVVRYNCVISLYVNEIASVIQQDLAASDGAVQALDQVLLPSQGDDPDGWTGDMSIDRFKALLAPFVKN